jgi:hypothetical protein
MKTIERNWRFGEGRKLAKREKYGVSNKIYWLRSKLTLSPCKRF